MSIFHQAVGNLAVTLLNIVMVREVKLKTVSQQGENMSILYTFSTQ